MKNPCVCELERLVGCTGRPNIYTSSASSPPAAKRNRDPAGPGPLRGTFLLRVSVPWAIIHWQRCPSQGLRSASPQHSKRPRGSPREYPAPSIFSLPTSSHEFGIASESITMDADIRPLKASSSEGRPYRSHVHPACLSCKKRKSRCRTKDSSEACMMCQAHGTECVFPHADERLLQRSSHSLRGLSAVDRRARSARENLMSPAAKVSSKDTPRPVDERGGVRPQFHSPFTGPQDHPPLTASHPRHDETMPAITGIAADTGDNSSHVVSPAVVGDNDVLESYLSAMPEARHRRPIRTNSSSSRLARPVSFNTVPRRPLGVAVNQSLAATKCEVIEKYIEPDAKDLLDT
jgi:hypothetical protein